jgi:hypothetical protein
MRPKRRRARLKASTKSAATGKPDKQACRQPRGRGRPKGAKNKATVALENARQMLDGSRIGLKKQATKEPKQILLESANYFYRRAEWLRLMQRSSPKKTPTSSIEAIMDKPGNQLVLACKCAEQASPYFHARISGPIADGDLVVSCVSRLPAPCASSEEWSQNARPADESRTPHTNATASTPNAQRRSLRHVGSITTAPRV